MDSDVNRLCEEYWNWRLQESPEFATYCGSHVNDDKLDDMTESKYLNNKCAVEDFLQTARQIDSSSLNEKSGLDLLLLKEELQTFLDGLSSKGYLFPLNFMEGFHVDSYDLISWMRFETTEDYQVYLRRLEQFPSRCRDIQSVLEQAVREGLTNHQVSMAGVIEQFEAMADQTDEGSMFLVPFKTRPSNVDGKIFEKFKEDTKKIISTKVLPAMETLKQYVQDVYMQHLRPEVGVSSLPGGADFYQKCLNFHLSQQMAPQEIHELGLKEVERIKAAMATLIEAEGYKNKGLSDFRTHLHSRKEFFFNTSSDLLDYVKHICYEKIRPVLPKLFKDIPESQLEIKEFPSFLADSPVGFYRAGTYDGSRTGVYSINTNKLQANPKYELMALSLHEGEPGHHFQAVNTFAQKDLPGFRVSLEDTKFYAVPSHFPLYSANIEGWGLYSEALGEELGLYEDNFSMIGRYSLEIHRASRLVVDTGLHAMGWSREAAVSYLSTNSMLDSWSVNNEINRYITWPGQACAYKIGEMKIWELRRKAEKELDDLFDVRDFHSWILKAGPVPLHVMDTLNRQFIQRTKRTG